MDRLAKTFRDTEGDLDAVTAALIEAPEAWTTPLDKMRTPLEFAVGGLRATGRRSRTSGAMLGALNALGQPLWQPPGPNGWPDRADAWASPEGMDARLDLAAQWGTAEWRPQPQRSCCRRRARPGGVARDARRRSPGPRAGRRASRILFMSPEFQRR